MLGGRSSRPLCTPFLILLSWLPVNRARDLRYASTRSPVVFIPGNGGNQMDVMVDRPDDKNDPCPTKQNWHRLWLDIWSLRSGRVLKLTPPQQVKRLLLKPAFGKEILKMFGCKCN